MGNWILIGLLFLCLSRSLLWSQASSRSDPPQDIGHQTHTGTLKQHEKQAHEVHCSRERSRAAWKVIDEYLMPFVAKEKYKIPSKCRLHPDNDMFRDQELHKIHVDINEWKCGYCKKSFYAEKYLDNHLDNRHYNLLNTTERNCLADLCGALHCDLVMDSQPRKTKCNPAAAAKNRHLCESLADTCFPATGGPSASRLHEFFLHQFCDAHACSGGRKPFSRGGKQELVIPNRPTPVNYEIIVGAGWCFAYGCKMRPFCNERFNQKGFEIDQTVYGVHDDYYKHNQDHILNLLNFSEKRTSGFYIAISVLTLMLLPLFYGFVYLYQRGLKRSTQDLRRISETGRKKKSS